MTVAYLPNSVHVTVTGIRYMELTKSLADGKMNFSACDLITSLAYTRLWQPSELLVKSRKYTQIFTVCSSLSSTCQHTMTECTCLVSAMARAY